MHLENTSTAKGQTFSHAIRQNRTPLPPPVPSPAIPCPDARAFPPTKRRPGDNSPFLPSASQQGSAPRPSSPYTSLSIFSFK